MVFFITGCTTPVVPKTVKQIQLASYAELAQITVDVRDACSERLITKDTCIDLSDKLKTAARLIDINQPASDIIELIRSTL
jgi:hypothetical protein